MVLSASGSLIVNYVLIERLLAAGNFACRRDNSKFLTARIPARLPPRHCRASAHRDFHISPRYHLAIGRRDFRISPRSRRDTTPRDRRDFGFRDFGISPGSRCVFGCRCRQPKSTPRWCRYWWYWSYCSGTSTPRWCWCARAVAREQISNNPELPKKTATFLMRRVKAQEGVEGLQILGWECGRSSPEQHHYFYTLF